MYEIEKISVIGAVLLYHMISTRMYIKYMDYYHPNSVVDIRKGKRRCLIVYCRYIIVY